MQDMVGAAHFLGIEGTKDHLMNLLRPISTKINQRVLRDLQVSKYQATQKSIATLISKYPIDFEDKMKAIVNEKQIELFEKVSATEKFSFD